MSDPFSDAGTRTFDLSGVSVMVAMPVYREVPAGTVRGLLETQYALIKRGISVSINMGVGSSLVHNARSKAAWDFLQSKYSRLFWIDSDIDWQPEDFLRILALSTVKEVVCGMYPVKRDPPLFLLNEAGIDGEVKADNYGCIQVGGLGLGFACIQRKVMEELAEKAPKIRFMEVNDGEPIPAIFRCDTLGESARGEDMAFFADVRDLGSTFTS